MGAELKLTAMIEKKTHRLLIFNTRPKVTMNISDRMVDLGRRQGKG